MGFFSDMFGGNTGAGDAEKKYMQYMQQALANLQGHEATGRSDITGALKQGLGFQQPYMEAGKSALGAYMGSMGLPGGDGAGGAGGAGYGVQQGAVDRFTQSPGYQYALNQGLSAASRGAAATGLSGSGAAQKELQRRGQGMADLGFGQYQGRLAGLAGMGQHASDVSSQMAYGTGGELAQQGLGYAGQETGVYGQMGQSAAEAEMAEAADKNRKSGNMWSSIGALAGFGGMFGSGGLASGGSGLPGGSGGSGGGANDPFAGGGSPTNPYTGAPYPGGSGGGAQGQQQKQQGFSLMQLLPLLMAIL